MLDSGIIETALHHESINLDIIQKLYSKSTDLCL